MYHPSFSVGASIARPCSVRHYGGICGIRMVRFPMVDDLEVLFLHAAEIDPLDMDEPQQLSNRLGHRVAAFVTRAAALCYADPGPEFLLVQAQAPADFPRVHEIKEFHVRSATPEIWQYLCQQHGACQGRNMGRAGLGLSLR